MAPLQRQTDDTRKTSSKMSSSSSRATLNCRANSHPFEERVLALDVPAKVGRSHKDADNVPKRDNAFFDCKVLSRQHALILVEDGKFYVADTGSSNGTFVNNNRLSKSGEESPLMRLYDGDALRFGSDVLDKARNATQKCIVAKVGLVHADGTRESTRPFKANAPEDDLAVLAKTLQESLKREKCLEDKLNHVRDLIGKNIGRTHTDLLKLFEKMKTELEASDDDIFGFDATALEKIANENLHLTRRVQEAETNAEEHRQAALKSAKDQQDLTLEMLALKKACQLQKRENEALVSANEDLRDEIHRNRLDADQRYNDKVGELEETRKDTVQHFEAELRKQEEIFLEERSKIKEQLHEVTSNEVNLLNRIKCLEAEEGYSHAEVERVLVQGREMTEENSALKYRVECLEERLNEAKAAIATAEANVVIERSEEDVAAIVALENDATKYLEEIAYLKKELIEARARKSASDDELATVRGKFETLENSVESLSSEGLMLRKRIADLEKALDEASSRAQHLDQLVARMEDSATQDDVIRVRKL